MVSYHYMFLIFKYFEVYPDFNEVVSISPVWFGLLQFIQMFMQIWMNLILYLDPSSGAQVHPNLIEVVEIYPNVSIKTFVVHLDVCKCIWISMELFVYSPTLNRTVWSYPQLNKAVTNCKFDLVDGLYPVISYLCSLNVFYFNLICTKLFSFAQI